MLLKCTKEKKISSLSLTLGITVHMKIINKNLYMQVLNWKYKKDTIVSLGGNFICQSYMSLHMLFKEHFRVFSSPIGSLT